LGRSIAQALQQDPQTWRAAVRGDEARTRGIPRERPRGPGDRGRERGGERERSPGTTRRERSRKRENEREQKKETEKERKRESELTKNSPTKRQPRRPHLGPGKEISAKQTRGTPRTQLGLEYIDFKDVHDETLYVYENHDLWSMYVIPA